MADNKTIGGPISGGRGSVQGMVRQPPAGSKSGSIVGTDSASEAVAILHGENPQKWHDLGPHHHDNHKGKM